MTDTSPDDSPPPFDAAFDGEDVEQRLYGEILRTRTPTAATAIADAVGCDPKTARKYLEWFAELGVVVRHDGRPTTYERNDDYFEWRTVQRLANEHTADELQRTVARLTAKIDRYEDEYGVESPDDVDVLAVDGEATEAVYDDVSDWVTAIRDRQRYERAHQRLRSPFEQASG